MDKKILRKLSREDLLTMLIEQSKELETLKTSWSSSLQTAAN